MKNIVKTKEAEIATADDTHEVSMTSKGSPEMINMNNLIQKHTYTDVKSIQKKVGINYFIKTLIGFEITYGE